MATDWVDNTIDELSNAQPELDTMPSELVLRVLLLGRRLEERIDKTLAPLGLQIWEFDVLAALRRQGPPCRLASGDLARHAVVTCSGLTHRVSRLSERGLVARTRDDVDRRTVFVELTDPGRALVDRAIQRRIDDNGALVESLPYSDCEQMIGLLRRLNVATGGD